LPDGNMVAVDYVDFVYLYGNMYLGAGSRPHTQPATRDDLGAVVTTVNCMIGDLVADYRHQVVGPFHNGNAAFLPVGAALYSVAGFEPSCRVAAIRDHRVVVYLAQHEVNKHTATLPCVLGK
jgi:hypothetical protein